jgi:UPF0716 protein FxsA
MPLFFLLALFLFVYAEIALVIEVGSRIGALGVIAAFVLSAALGILVIRRQGTQAFRRLQQSFAAGSDPLEDISNGFLVLLGGFLLIVPGFVTDALGLLLLVPWVRRFLVRRGTVSRVRVFYGSTPSPRPRPGGPGVIEGEFEEKDGPKTGGRAKRLPRQGGA